MRRILILFFAAAFIYSCQDKGRSEKGDLLTTTKMQAVMWDMLLADAFTEKYLKTDSSKKELPQVAALQQKIFELHQIKRDDFYKSYNYYSSRPDVMRIILDSISTKAERERGGLMMEHYSGNRSIPPPVKEIKKPAR